MREPTKYFYTSLSTTKPEERAGKAAHVAIKSSLTLKNASLKELRDSD